MTTIPIKFEYTLESETMRVSETLKNIEWLKGHNYTYSLPASISKNVRSDIEKMPSLVAQEYDPTVYKVAQDAILKSWMGNSGTIRNINRKMPASYQLEDVIILLTRYGTRGSYKAPNRLVVNICSAPPEFLIKTVVHETIHLMLNELIKKYSINHWIKERIVDLIVEREFVSRFKPQSLPNWALRVDTPFNDYYPDIAKIMQSASEINCKENTK